MGRTKRTHPTGGFTLVELLATMTVLSIISVVASGIIVNSSQAYLEANTAAQLHTELSIGFDRLAREIRNIPLDPSASAARSPDIDAVETYYLQWDDTKFIFFLTGDVLLQVDGAGTSSTLLTDVTAFTIQTYDESNTALGTSLTGAACDPVRRVELSATMTRHGVSESLRMRVFVRGASTQATG